MKGEVGGEVFIDSEPIKAREASRFRSGLGTYREQEASPEEGNCVAAVYVSPVPVCQKLG